MLPNASHWLLPKWWTKQQAFSVPEYILWLAGEERISSSICFLSAFQLIILPSFIREQEKNQIGYTSALNNYFMLQPPWYSITITGSMCLLILALSLFFYIYIHTHTQIEPAACITLTLANWENSWSLEEENNIVKILTTSTAPTPVCLIPYKSQCCTSKNCARLNVVNLRSSYLIMQLNVTMPAFHLNFYI